MFRFAPPILRREVALYFAGPPLILLGVMMPVSWPPAGQVLAMCLAFTLMLCGVASSGAALILFRKKLARIEAAKHSVCSCCGHCIGEVPTDACPECGVPVDLVRLRSFWRRYLQANLHYGRGHSGRVSGWLRRVMARTYAAVAIAWLLVFTLLVLSIIFLPQAAILISMLAMFFTTYSLRIAPDAVGRWVCAQVVRESGRVCIKCGSRVEDCDDGLRCTACGTQFTAEELSDYWEEWRAPCWDIEQIQSGRPPD